ncbi:uncharacterized protein LOC132593051 isoform X1 [Zootoca vivipara]|uniref:uncharacterized protein LOC132593051 isoform X1 n=1 Tax=Zootoca vivipara TaxID=8524 RepID=UPI00293BAF81|nr:uncharacterized protein LOC132593051 isoform X1 [Zootoca vivipara]
MSSYEIIRKGRKQLIDILQKNIDCVLDELRSEIVITKEEYEGLEKYEDSKKKSRELLILIQAKGEAACCQFLECLEVACPGSNHALHVQKHDETQNPLQSFGHSVLMSESHPDETQNPLQISGHSVNYIYFYIQPTLNNHALHVQKHDETQNPLQSFGHSVLMSESHPDETQNPLQISGHSVNYIYFYTQPPLNKHALQVQKNDETQNPLQSFGHSVLMSESHPDETQNPLQISGHSVNYIYFYTQPPLNKHALQVQKNECLPPEEKPESPRVLGETEEAVPEERIIRDLQPLLDNDSSLSQALGGRPFIAYRQPPNLNQLLTHNNTTTRLNMDTGTRACNEPRCQICCHIHPDNIITGPNNIQHTISGLFNCSSSNIVYAIKCQQCPSALYIGQTGQTLRQRINRHKSDIRNHKKSVREHFNLPGHSIQDLKAAVLLQENFRNRQEREDAEFKLITKLKTMEPPGMN